MERSTTAASRSGREADKPLSLRRARIPFLLALLALAGLAGNYFSLPLFYGVDFLFGSIAALLAAAAFGPLAGAAVALVGALYTLFLWDHPYAMLILVSEALAVGWLLRRYAHIELTAAAALFWLLLGMPLAWLTYSAALGMDTQATLLVVLKQGVNGIFNALVAALLLYYTPLRRWLGGSGTGDDAFPLRGGLFHLTGALVLVAVMALTALEGRGEFRNIETEVGLRLERTVERSARFTEQWLAAREGSLRGLAERAGELGVEPGEGLAGAAGALVRVDRSLRWVAVVQPDGTVVAAGGRGLPEGDGRVRLQPPRGAAPRAGAATIAVREDGRHLLRLAVPVADRGGLRGYVMGDFEMDALTGVLAADARTGGLGIALIDAHGATLFGAEVPGSPAGEWVAAGVSPGGLRFAMPSEALGAPPMERWRRSVYVHEAPLAQAAAVAGAVRVELPAAPYRERLYGAYITTLATGLGVLLAGLLIAHVASRRIVAPIRMLAAATGEVPEGLRRAARAHWPRSRFAEVAELTRNFQVMVDVLQRQFGELEHVKEALERRAGELAAAQGKLNRILHAVEDVLWSAHLDEQGNVRVDYVSPAVQRAYGYDPQVLAGRAELWVELAHPAWRERVRDALHALAQARVDEMDEEFCIRTRSGEERHVRNRAWLTRDGSGGAWRIDGILSDVTEWREAQDQLRLSATVFESTAEAIMITGPDHRIVSVNRAFSDITGYAPEEVVGQLPYRLFAPRHAPAFFAEIHRAVAQQGQWRGEAWGRRRDEEEYPQWLSVTAVESDVRAGRHHIALFSDISERRAREEHIRQLAHYDFLTGLPNRALFQELLAQALLGAQRQGNQLAVLFLDLDRFKNVNDSLGHQVGDELLREVARRLAGCTRAVDVVSRQGGDEFVILLTDVEDALAAGQVAGKVLQTVAQPYQVLGHELSITPSVGIAMYPHDGSDMDVLMKHADVAMYHAKGQGRNNFQFFTPAMNAAAGERLRLEHALRHALRRDELVLRYQPQIEADSGRVVGVEALVSWRHPRKGLLPPQRFVPLAEETGLIVPLGEWVLHAACAQARRWQDAGVQGVSVAVNLSPVQVHHGDLPAMVRGALEASGIAPDCLELELTENVIMPGDQRAAAVLKALKDMGVRIAVDDFGTGYSNLSYLRRFPLDKLKIDRSFVNDMTHDAGDAAIVSAIIGLGKKLHCSVLAEGVETSAQFHHLRDEGCDQLQGYYVCRPVDGERLMDLLGARRKVH